MKAYIFHQLIQQGFRLFSTTSHSWIIKTFLESIVLFFFDKINIQVYEDFEQFFVTNQGFLASKKYKK